MAKADLHIHTTASDGKSSPEEILTLAGRLGLEVIAITDHDTIRGYSEAAEAAEKYGVEVISGIEITADFGGRECHLLAYAFDPGHSAIRRLCLLHRKARIERGKWILEQLSRKGLELDIEEVKAEANWGNVGRPHIASLLVKKGYVASSREAFMRYLSDRALGPIENDYYPHDEVIGRVREAGGATVLAHPGQLYSPLERELFAGAGIDGIEVYHPSHDDRTREELKAFAEEHDLLITGGSDFHGSPDDYRGRFGVETIRRSLADRLVRRAQQKSKISV